VPEAVAVPVFPPLQVTDVEPDIEADKADGSVKVTLAVVVQLLASLTVTVYTFADSPVAIAVVCPPELQTYVIEPVPPLPVAVAVPVLSPLHVTDVEPDIEAVNTDGSVIVTFAVVVQLLASLTVTVYTFADNPVAIAVVCPPELQTYVIEPVPPLPVAVAVPVLSPLHVTDVEPDIEAVNADGSATTIVIVSVQLFNGSVRVTEYVPEPIPARSSVVSPLDQR
jgi:hypothetical protein